VQGVFDPAGRKSLTANALVVGMQPHFVAMRVAGLTALFVAAGSLLAAERSLTAHQAGALAVLLAAGMLTAHVAWMRAGPAGRPSAEARLAGLFGLALLAPGLLLLFLQRPGLNETSFLFFEVSNSGGSRTLFALAAAAASLYAAGRHPRWLLVAPLALVGGIQFAISSGRSEASLGGGSWTRFLIFLVAIGALAGAGRLAGGAVERNLLVAAAVLAPLMFEAVPGRKGSLAAGLIGAAMLAGLAVVLRGRVTIGTGLGMLALALAVVSSVAAHGQSKTPAVVFALVGAALLATTYVRWAADQASA
jgi:hypothetical protein